MVGNMRSLDTDSFPGCPVLDEMTNSTQLGSEMSTKVLPGSNLGMDIDRLRVCPYEVGCRDEIRYGHCIFGMTEAAPGPSDKDGQDPAVA